MSGHDLPTTLPTDMWHILLRLDTASARLEPKVDAVAADITRIGNKLDHHETRIQSIEASLAVSVLKMMKIDEQEKAIDALKEWQTKTLATVQATRTMMGVITTLFGAQIVGVIGFIAKSYMA